MTISKHRRYWAVRDPDGSLVCLTVYKRGATEVVRRLEAPISNSVETAPPPQKTGVSHG